MFLSPEYKKKIKKSWSDIWITFTDRWLFSCTRGSHHTMTVFCYLCVCAEIEMHKRLEVQMIAQILMIL